MVKRLSWEGWPRRQVRKDGQESRSGRMPTWHVRKNGHWPRRQVRKDGQHGMPIKRVRKDANMSC